MNIWIPLALVAGSLTTPALASQHGTSDAAIITAKKEVAEAQAHLEQLLAARETKQLIVTAANNTAAPEFAWEVVSSAGGDCDSCSAHKPSQMGHSGMGSFRGMHPGPHAMGFESNTNEMDCSFGDMPMQKKKGHGMQHGHHGKGFSKAGTGHGMPMGSGNDGGCQCGMMSPGMGHGKAPHGMQQRMMDMFGGHSEEPCPHASKGHGNQKGHGRAPRASMRGMMFMDGQEGSSHGNRGWSGSDRDDCGNGWADQDDDNQAHQQAWWFDDDSDDANGEWKKQVMVFGNREQHFERLSGDRSHCDFDGESSDEAECDEWRDGDDCELGLDANGSKEFTFEITDEDPNWVTGMVTFTEDDFTGDLDGEIEVLLRRLEADGTEARVIRISSDDDINPEQLQAMIEIELEGNACNASEDVDSEIDALIREIECSINADVAAEEPILETAEVQVHVIDESASRIEELEGEVAELRDLVESLVKELNKN